MEVRDIGSPGAGVASSCVWLGTGNWTWVPGRTKLLLTTELSLQPPCLPSLFTFTFYYFLLSQVSFFFKCDSLFQNTCLKSDFLKSLVVRVLCRPFGGLGKERNIGCHCVVQTSFAVMSSCLSLLNINIAAAYPCQVCFSSFITMFIKFLGGFS